jgi:hypothetical protein
VGADARAHAVEELGLELLFRLQPVCIHEGLDLGIGLPVRAGDLVASDVEILVREQRRHLPEEAIEEGNVSGLAGLRAEPMAET